MVKEGVKEGISAAVDLPGVKELARCTSLEGVCGEDVFGLTSPIVMQYLAGLPGAPSAAQQVGFVSDLYC